MTASGTPYTAADRNTVRAMRAEGASFRECGQALGRSALAVQSWVERGLPVGGGDADGLAGSDWEKRARAGTIRLGLRIAELQGERV